MKKNVLVIVLLSLVLTLPCISFSQAIPTVSSNQLSISYCFEQPTIDHLLRDGRTHDSLTIPSCSLSTNPDGVLLPSRGAYILIPYCTEMDDITVETSDAISLGCGYRLEPVSPTITEKTTDQPFSSESYEDSLSLGTTIDHSYYRITGVYWFRGYQILILQLFPVMYVKETGEISYISKLTITFNLKPANANPLYRGLPNDVDQVRKKVDNPEYLGTYPVVQQSPSDVYDLLVITINDFKDDFLRLKNFHDARGIRTQIKTLLADIPVSYDPDHTCSNIRDYIRNEYSSKGISFVLIGGDSDIIPVRGLTPEGGGFIDSDLFYQCLDGTYNYDNDAAWGEPHDGDNGADVDLLADVDIGRACVGNAEEITNFIDKTIGYLTTHNAYLTKSLLLGARYDDITWGDDYCEQFIDTCTDDGYTTNGIPSEKYAIDKLYDHEWPDYNWPGTEVITRINEGVHLINYVGRGSYDRSMKLYSFDIVDYLTNYQYCFVYARGTCGGWFSMPSDDCFGEYMTVKTHQGAFAGIWHSVDGFYQHGGTDGVSQRYQRQFWDAVFGENIRILSQANQDSKEDNLYRINEEYMRIVYYELNLFGDPTVALRNLKEINISSVSHEKNIIIATIQNIGFEELNSLQWSISVRGGVLNRINITTSDIIDTLLVGDTTDVAIDRSMFGLGRIQITVTAVASETDSVTTTRSGFILGPWILYMEE